MSKSTKRGGDVLPSPPKKERVETALSSLGSMYYQAGKSVSESLYYSSVNSVDHPQAVEMLKYLKKKGGEVGRGVSVFKAVEDDIVFGVSKDNKLTITKKSTPLLLVAEVKSDVIPDCFEVKYASGVGYKVEMDVAFLVDEKVMGAVIGKFFDSGKMDKHYTMYESQSYTSVSRVSCKL
jgi:hypothetical protein